ncbi:Aste57867_8337 [Aphanomyces stellatus]|uniref:Aste57867_8337 protein n=1 Tax=Aphanomyces stellatus TaxID=120398 RepID=A0A485KJZ1_9STRA|nr:hypothetical protein As57867_008305 [Aphanomyces stellatus]VFT85224.1 Aste57867_8337 [Aphanomyces stellatus]
MQQAPSIDPPFDEITDKKVRRRVYLKHMRRMYRREAKEERVYLLNKIHELEHRLEPLQDRFRLPWRDVAIALGEARHVASTNCSKLLTRVKEMDLVVWEMQRWVAAQVSLQGGLGSHVPTWREWSLLANPQSRHLGKAWIMQHMFHNTDRVFLEHGFPPREIDFHHFDITMAPPDEGGARMTMGLQLDAHRSNDSGIPLTSYCQHMCLVLRTNFHMPVPPHTVAEVENGTWLHRMPTANGECVNLLTARFDHLQGMVVVAQEIIDDESLSMGDDDAAPMKMRGRSFWAEEWVMPDGVRRHRSILILSQRVDRWKQTSLPVPLEEEGPIWGCDLTRVRPEMRDVRFRDDVRRIWLGLGPSPTDMPTNEPIVKVATTPPSSERVHESNR